MRIRVSKPFESMVSGYYLATRPRSAIIPNAPPLLPFFFFFFLGGGGFFLRPATGAAAATSATTAGAAGTAAGAPALRALNRASASSLLSG